LEEAELRLDESSKRERKALADLALMREQMERIVEGQRADETRWKMKQVATGDALEAAKARLAFLESENSRIPALEDAKERVAKVEKENAMLKKMLKKEGGAKKGKAGEIVSPPLPPPPAPAPAAAPSMLHSPRQLLRSSTLLGMIQSKEGTLRHVVTCFFFFFVFFSSFLQCSPADPRRPRYAKRRG